MINDDIFYAASLMEYVARATKNRLHDVAEYVGLPALRHLTEYACVNHCLSFALVAEEVITDHKISNGAFDAVGRCLCQVPGHMDIGKVYARLVEDTATDEDAVQRLYDILRAPISDEISDFNSSLYYASRSELAYRFQELQAKVAE